MGLLLNVDYNDPLTRIRAREVLRRLDAFKYVGEEEAADAFYLHYRKPIFGRGADGPWPYFVKAYVSSEYYKAVWPICRLNPKASREAAARLLKAYQRFLDSLESGRDRFWRGRGLWLKWSEVLRNIRRLFGDPHDVYRLYASLKRLGDLLGTGRSADPASLALSIAADPLRLKLADIIADAARLASSVGPADLDGGESQGIYMIEGIRNASIRHMGRATNTTKALYLAARVVFAYRAATSTLSAKYYVMRRTPPLYILLDKSGSMYDVVQQLGVRRISVAAALAIALFRRAKGSILRLFDADVHKPSDGGDVFELLLRVAPSGGTSLAKAVEFAIEEAGKLGAKKYGLAVITDGEDDSADKSVFEKAKNVFNDVKIYLVGKSGLGAEGVKVVSALQILGRGPMAGRA
ncbi:MAG: hypothetical protein ABWJ97_03650 [Thermoproteus sp.]